MPVAEILVHVAAGEADVHARRLAAAYNDFSPQRRHRLAQLPTATRMRAPASSRSARKRRSRSNAMQAVTGPHTPAAPAYEVPPPDGEVTFAASTSSSPAAELQTSTPASADDRPADATRPPSLAWPRTHAHVLPPRAPLALLPASESHITPSLARLATLLPLATHFLPVAREARAPRRLERGHWAVATAGWGDDGLAAAFWAAVAGFVQAGRAGWGTSCAAEAGEVRVYCWGETLGHVYLLLYTASRSRVKRGGAAWIDADGRAVVTVAGGGR